MYIPVHEQCAEFKDLPLEELQARRQILETDIALIKYQLDLAKHKREQLGEYSDIEWFNKTQLALRFKGILHQAVLGEISKKKKALQKTNDVAVANVFVTVAREKLSPNIFNALLDEAIARCN